MSNKSQKIFLLFALAGLIGAVFFIYQTNDHNTEPEIVYGNAIYAYDVSNDKVLVGAATDVFIGKVIEQVGTSPDPNLRTHFSVEIIETIKGNATGKVIVNQMGGYETIDGKQCLLLMEGDELLQPGETYLFTTRGNNDRGYTFTPGYGDIPIKNQTIYQREKSRFEKAYAEEIPADLPEVRTT